MRNIILIFGLIIIGLNISAQDLERDVVRVEEELYVRDTTIKAFVEEHTSASSVGAENGLTKTGSNIGLGGTLDQTTEIAGDGYSYKLGTTASKIGGLQINSNTDMYFYADGVIEIQANGVIWEVIGDLIINQNTGDTLAVKSDISSLIDAALPLLPFNYNYTFDPIITDSRPGIGKFRLDNATYANVNYIFIDYFDSESVDKSNNLQLADTGSYITITDGTNYINYQLTGALTAGGSYYKYEVTYQNSVGVISGAVTINFDNNNDVGGSGGLADKLANATDTITLVNDTLSMASQILDAQTVVGDTIYVADTLYTPNISSGGDDIDIVSWDGTPGPPGGDIGITAESDIRITSETSYIVLQTSTDEAIRLGSGSNTIEHLNDTLNADGSGNSTAINLKFKTGQFTDSIYVGNTWITGADVSGKFTIDTTETSVLILDKDGTPDTITGALESKYVMENTIINELNFNDTTYDDHQEGRLSYDTHTKSLVFQDDITGTSTNLGYEFNRRVYNNTASVIPDGAVVRRTGTYENGEITITVGLAGNSTLDSALVAGIATADIQPSSYGKLALLGDVNGLNTIGLTNLFYLGHAGEKIDTSPHPPYYSVRLGSVVKTDNDSGKVSVIPTIPVYDPNPVLNAYFTREAETITNPGLDVFEYITNATNDLFIVTRNKGFLAQGDSIQVLQDGIYSGSFSYSFQGDAVQGDIWRIGYFVDGVEIFSIARTSSTTNVGGVPFTATSELTAGQWISFRVSNTASATRDCIFSDAIISINYTE